MDAPRGMNPMIPQPRTSPVRVPHDASPDPIRQLIDAAPDPVFATAADGPDAGAILDANARATATYGYSREELLAMTIDQFDAPAEAAVAVAHREGLLATGARTYATRHRRRDGSTFPVEVSARLATLHGRRCVIAFHRDATERQRTQQQLDEDGVRLTMAARAGGIGFWDWDLDTNHAYFSPEWKAQIGYGPEEIAPTYEEWRRRVHPDDLDAVLASEATHVAEGRDHHDVEFRLRHKDGTYRWIHSRGQWLRGPDGRPRRMLGCHIDITARKAAEAKQQEADYLLRSFFDSPGVLRGIVELEGDDIVNVSANAVSRQTLGIRADELPGRRVSELGFPRSTMDLWIRHYRQSEREGRPISFDYTRQTPRGPVHLFCTVVKVGGEGDRPRFAYAAYDRSAQERAEAEVAEFAERMRAIYETDPECIKTVSCDGRLLDMNPAGLQMIEAGSFDQVRGENIENLVVAEDRPAFRELHRRVVAGGSGRLLFRLRGLRGTERWMETHSVPLRDRNGAVRSVLSVTRDVTAARLEQQHREEIARHLEQVQRLEAIGTLSGGIAHDFNNILAAISGNLQLAMMTTRNETELGEYLGEIQKASERGRLLVRQILTFGRPQVPDRRPIDLRQVVSEAAAFLRATLSATIAIEVRSAADLPNVLADPAQMHQVIVNLGTNGAHAMETRGGRLRLELSSLQVDGTSPAPVEGLAAGQYVCLDVHDDGIGMDEAIRRRCLEPFFTTKPIGKGTGLGLSVVHGIVSSHGGRISIASQSGAGTHVRIHLPTVDATATPPPGQRPASPGNGRRILVVDDEPALLRVLGPLLSRYGYQVTTCAEPMRALAMVAEAPQRFDLVVTDSEMPGMPGTALARRLHGLAPGLPILLCSGYLRPEVQAEAPEIGIRRLLQKPVDPLDLANAIQDLLKATEAGR